MPPRHADAIIPPPEAIVVSTKRVACDGGGGALGHQRVFLNLGDEKAVDCPYCGRHNRPGPDTCPGCGATPEEP